MNAFSQFADVLLSRLVWTSIQATVLIALVLLITRLLPRVPAALRCTLWWLVSLQLLLGLCSHVPLALPLPSAVAAMTSNAPNLPAPVSAAAHVAIPLTASHHSMPYHEHSLADRAGGRFSHWREWLAALWLAALLAQLPLLARQWWRTRRLLDGAKPLTDAPMQALCVERARALGLRRCPPLYACAAIESPQVSGLRQPVVLLPAMHAMTPAETAMAIAHELAHLRRGDLWLGWLPALAGRLFFFHPLVRWALREYAFEREAACDAEVLRQTGTPPHAYAQLLLRLGVSHPMHAGLAGASPTFQNLKRRLTMLQQTSGTLPRTRGWLLVTIVALLGVLPYRVVATTHAAAAAMPAPASATALPPPPPAPPAPPAPSAPPLPPAPPAPPSAPTGIAAPPAPASSRSALRRVDREAAPNTQDCAAANGIPFCGAKSLVFTKALHEGHGLVLFDQGRVVIAATNDDILAAKPLYRPDAKLLWFRHAGKTYVVRSPAALLAADDLIAGAGIPLQTPNARDETIQQLVAEKDPLLARKGELVAQEGKLVDQQSRLVALQAAAPNPARQQQALARIDAQRDALRQQAEVLDGQTSALQQRIRRQQANLHAQQHSPWGEPLRLATGLTKLANGTLADGSAREVLP